MVGSWPTRLRERSAENTGKGTREWIDGEEGGSDSVAAREKAGLIED